MKDPDHIQHKDEVYFYLVFFYFPQKWKDMQMTSEVRSVSVQSSSTIRSMFVSDPNSHTISITDCSIPTSESSYVSQANSNWLISEFLSDCLVVFIHYKLKCDMSS